MNKRNYKITPSTYTFFKVEMWNDFGMKRTVYEENIMDASEVIMDWWERSEEEFDKMKCEQIVLNNLVKKEL
tara:strand:- start:670 stop:885 length:216 start_codon:yes stop_codon:yes gene_type:complete